MRVLALASQKGGSGKTTLSGHLAVQAQLSGAGPVCLIDIDPQQEWLRAFATGRPVTFSEHDFGVVLRVPAESVDPIDTIVALDLDR